MIYRLFGWLIRREACKLAAIAVQGSGLESEVCPRLWSLTVFFESYMMKGADGTNEDFGPHDPVELRVTGTAPKANR